MGKFLPLFLLAVLVGLLFFVNMPQKSTEAIFKSTVKKYSPVYLKDFSEISSDEFSKIAIATRLGKNYSLSKGSTEMGEMLYYWYGRNLLGIDCSKYSGAAAILCLSTKIKIENKSEFINKFKSIELKRFLDVYAGMFFYESMKFHTGEPEDDLKSYLCLDLFGLSKEIVPQNSCDYFYLAASQDRCGRDKSIYQEAAIMKPKTSKDFFCYYRSYLWYIGDPV